MDYENIYHQEHGPTKSEAIGFIFHIAQLLAEESVEIERVSPIFYRNLSVLMGTQKQDLLKNYMKLLHSNLSSNFICLENGTETHNIYVSDSYTFQVLLLVSLRHEKMLFLEDNKDDLHFIILSVLQLLQPSNVASLHLLHLLEVIVKKKSCILPHTTAMLILKTMNAMACSPLVGFKRSAHVISRFALKFVNFETKKSLVDCILMNVRGISLEDLIPFIESDRFLKDYVQITLHILKLFKYNVDSRDGSFYYKALVGQWCELDNYARYLHPLYSSHLTYFKAEDEGEFNQSLVKYWIPINVSQYDNDYYIFLKTTSASYKLLAQVFLETIRRGSHCTKDNKSQWLTEVANFLKYPETGILGMRILSYYQKKYQVPDEVEMDLICMFINYYPGFEFPPVVWKSIKHFLSQIFLTVHMLITKSDAKLSLDVYTKFLYKLYNFIQSRIDGEYSDVAAQLLLIIHDIAEGPSTNLITAYKLDLENTYEAGRNKFYLFLNSDGFWENSFRSPAFVNKINKYLNGCVEHGPYLVELVIKEYLNDVKVDNCDVLSVFNNRDNSVSLQNLETLQTYITLLLNYKHSRQIDLKNDTDKLLQNFIINLQDCLNPRNLFFGTCCLSYFYEAKNFIQLDSVFIVETSLEYIESIFHFDQHSHLDDRTIKTLEAFINVAIKFAVDIVQRNYSSVNKSKMLFQLCSIIKSSNMKRPASLAIQAVHILGSAMGRIPEDRNIKIRLLEDIFLSLYSNNERTGRSKIRRNLETRLVIQALVVSENSSSVKIQVKRTLDVLFDITSRESLPELSISSALNTMEVFVSDNSIHQTTLPYIPEIFKVCIRHFDSSSWVIRNADIQLLKSLIDRFLGVLLDDCYRTKTVVELLIVFPEMCLQFYETLSKEALSRGAIVTMLFFLESQLRPSLLTDEHLDRVLDSFRFLFAHIIKNHSDSDSCYGFLAAKSFTALCLSDEIPTVFCNIINYIKENFSTLGVNVFANLISLLGELFLKYESSIAKKQMPLLKQSMRDLTMYLEQFDCFHFNLLSLKLHNVDRIMLEIPEKYRGDSFKRRIWLNNYLPFVIKTADLNSLDDKLRFILKLDLPDYLQVKLLGCLVNRLEGLTDDVILTNFSSILIEKLIYFPDSAKFVITAYAKVILLLHEITSTLKLTATVVDSIRSDYETSNIYKMTVYIVVLQYVSSKTETDQLFLSKCVDQYVANTAENDEILFDIASTLQYLYRDAPQKSRSKIIKLAFYFLLHNVTSFEMCKFVSFTTNARCSNAIFSLYNLLHPKNLFQYLGDNQLVMRLLLDIYTYTLELPNAFQVSDTFYLIESDFSIPRAQIKRIVRKCILNVGRA